MSAGRRAREGLSEEQRRRLSALVLLDRVVTIERAFHAGLLEHEDDELLDPVFSYLLTQGLLEIGADDHYRATARGVGAYHKLLHLQQSYLAHFDIFARVDLAAGSFWDPAQDTPEEPRWSDLRVAVAEHKGIDPYRTVFLALLAEEHFFDNPDWKFDLALGSTFFSELEQLVAAQVSVDELGYTAEDGARVAGAEVLEDVLLQGARLNRERYEQRSREARRSLQTALFDPAGADDFAAQPNGAAADDGPGSAAPELYDPQRALAAYAANARFVEGLWLAPFW